MIDYVFNFGRVSQVRQTKRNANINRIRLLVAGQRTDPVPTGAQIGVLDRVHSPAFTEQQTGRIIVLFVSAHPTSADILN